MNDKNKSDRIYIVEKSSTITKRNNEEKEKEKELSQKAEELKEKRKKIDRSDRITNLIQNGLILGLVLLIIGIVLYPGNSNDTLYIPNTSTIQPTATITNTPLPTLDISQDKIKAIPVATLEYYASITPTPMTTPFHLLPRVENQGQPIQPIAVPIR